MPDLVSSIRIPDLLEKLRDGEYLIPQFQREFVWSISDVTALLNSILDSRPVGMLTVWEQPESSGLELEHISIPDGSAAEDDDVVAFFGDNASRQARFYAVLDGRQRSTAIAMAFGGLSATDARRKFSGKYFLNVGAVEPVDRVLFIKTTDVEKKGLTTLANCISAGLFPFEFNKADYEGVDKQWMDYVGKISDAQYYKDGKLPPSDELERRKKVLLDAFDGIINANIAVYAVPRKYDLGAICEIFETLNTTGTRVSTVDLIHSWLYSDTIGGATKPLLLREWIAELGQLDGAIGWSDPTDRPELIAQIVTACYLAEKSPPTARRVGGREHRISSVKSPDLLATPSDHWKNAIDKKEQIANYLKDFQTCVANGSFPLRDCPYPISAGIYVALRWTKAIDSRDWTIDDINSVYRSFFWRNALAGRYDQGFLTKMSTDLSNIIGVLDRRKEFEKYKDWTEEVSALLTKEVSEIIPQEKIKQYLLEAKPTGALAKAAALLIRGYPRRDLVDPSKSIRFGDSSEPVETHHIFPKDWVRNNVGKETQEQWANDGKGHVNCVANLTPMLKSSNLLWRAKIPGNALADRGVTYEVHKDVLDSHFIDKDGFELLTAHDKTPTVFWEHRAEKIAKRLWEIMAVQA